MHSTKQIVLIGTNGQVSWELRRTLAPLGRIITLGRENADRQLDLSVPDSITAAFRDLTPDIIVNAAAYTAVNKAEEESLLATTINATAPGILAEHAFLHKALLVHFSTDYVFDGNSKRPYTEQDATYPINVYGRSKLAGEQAIQAINPAHLILRTSWVYGNRGRNFLQTILRLIQERNELSVVDDQIGSPTWSRMIAEAAALLLNNLAVDSTRYRQFSGIYHLSSAKHTSWFGFTTKILQLIGKSDQIMLNPIKTAQYPLPARRPSYSVLSNRKLQQHFNITMPDWEQSLKLCLAENRDL